MVTQLVLGASYGFGAAVQPGPFQAYLVTETMTRGWRRTAPAVLAPLASDIPIITLVLLVLSNVPPVLVRILQVTGGGFLLYLAWGALRATYRYQQAVAAAPSARVTFWKAVLINFLNPNPYLGWGLVLGPLLHTAWRESPGAAIALVGCFYAALLVGTAAIVTLLAAARGLGPRAARALVGASALALLAFAIYQLWAGLMGSAPN